MHSGWLAQPGMPTSPGVFLLVPLAAVPLATVARPRWIVVPATLILAADLISRQNYGIGASWQQQSFDRLFLSVPLLGAVALLPARWLARRAAWRLIAPALALVFVVAGYRFVRARTTDQIEYRWTRERIAALPADCRLTWVAFAGERNLFLPAFLGARAPGLAQPLDMRHPPDLSALAGACTYYLHGSLCSSDDGRAACAAVEERLRLDEVARARFPARPSSDGLPYDRDPVETALYRVAGIR
jgi:hypothetical protein